MPKDTKTLANNKARAWESLGFAHKKRLCQHFDTTSFYCLYQGTTKKNRHLFGDLFGDMAYFFPSVFSFG